MRMGKQLSEDNPEGPEFLISSQNNILIPPTFTGVNDYLYLACHRMVSIPHNFNSLGDRCCYYRLFIYVRIVASEKLRHVSKVSSRW